MKNQEKAKSQPHNVNQQAGTSTTTSEEPSSSRMDYQVVRFREDELTLMETKETTAEPKEVANDGHMPRETDATTSENETNEIANADDKLEEDETVGTF